MKRLLILFGIFFFSMGVSNTLVAEDTNSGTTVANFLEIGMGSIGTGMGNAYTALANDPSSMFWNPAGLAFVKYNQFQFMNQPYLADININYLAFGIPIPNVGVIGLDITSLSMDDMKVRTVENPQGTGQYFTANDIAVSLGYARFITDWFSFGATAKYVREKIYSMSASAFAMNLGVNIQTGFFSVTENQSDGLIIGMSISNFGTKMKLDGINTLIPVDIEPNIDGNNDNIAAHMRTEEYPLPLLYRIGVAYAPLVSEHYRLNLEVDAIHPNNSTEYLNVGGEFQYHVNPSVTACLRSGYTKLFMKDSEEGLTFGGGIRMRISQMNFGFNYSYASFNRLDYVHRFGFSFFM